MSRPRPRRALRGVLSHALLSLAVAVTSTAAALVAAPSAAQAAPAAAAADPYSVLVFSKTAGFRHDSIPAGIAAIQQLGADNGFSVDRDRGRVPRSPTPTSPSTRP